MRVEAPALFMAAIDEVCLPEGPRPGRYWVNAIPLSIEDWPVMAPAPTALPMASSGIKTELEVVAPGAA